MNWIIEPETLYVMCLRDFKRFTRDRSQILASLGRPLIWLFIMGAGLRGSFKGDSSIPYTQFIFPGIITLSLLFSSMSSAITIVWDREFGFLKEILVAPVSRGSVAIGKAISGSLIACLQGSLVLVFAPFVGIELTFISIGKVLIVMFVMGVCLTSIGICIASRLTSIEGFGVISNFLIMPLFFLSGAMFPISNLPHVIDLLVRANPLTYGVDIMRMGLLGTHSFSLILNYTYLCCFTLLCLIVAVFMFRRSG